jgi:hypothetical protein
MISKCFHRPDEISATEISLGRQRCEGRRDVFSIFKAGSFCFPVALILAAKGAKDTNDYTLIWK